MGELKNTLAVLQRSCIGKNPCSSGAELNEFLCGMFCFIPIFKTFTQQIICCLAHKFSLCYPALQGSILIDPMSKVSDEWAHLCFRTGVYLDATFSISPFKE